MNALLLASEEGSNGTLTTIVGLIVAVLLIVAWWKIFEKAGEAGWKSIIPIYNLYTLVKIIDGNGWLFILLIIPIVGFIYSIILDYKMAKAFGKGIGYTIGIIILPNVFTLILGFGSAEYVGPQ